MTEIDIETGISEDISTIFDLNEQSKYIEPVISDIIEKEVKPLDPSTIKELPTDEQLNTQPNYAFFKKSISVPNYIVVSFRLFCAFAVMINAGYLISTIVACIKYNSFASI